MFKQALPFFIRAITPLHVGSGNDLGIVDLPIQREVHTGFPKIEGSTLKGSIRDAFELQLNNENEEIKLHFIFGYDGVNASEKVKKFFENEIEYTQFSGALGFTDAKILLFPVKSLRGVFAYITCPEILNRFKNDLEMANYEKMLNNFIIPQPNTVANNSNLILKEKQVVLEEYLFEVEENEEVSNLAAILSKLTAIEENSIKERLIILEDDDFADFVKLSTEVITRIKINNETGTVDSGALFTEEYLPAETVMYSLALISPLFIDEEKEINIKNKKLGEIIKEKTGFSDFSEINVKKFFEKIPQNLQIGGNETIGKGFIEVKLLEETNG